MPSTSSRGPAVPITVRVVQVVCLLHALLLAALAVVLGLDLVAGEVVVAPTTAMLMSVYGLLAVALVLGARGVGRGSYRWRGPLTTWWVLAGISVLTIDLPLAAGIGLAATCLAGVVALLWPETRAYTSPLRRTSR